jgi:8-oxo-dGTP pyrophosphatase MutT (NUDIX family)
MTAIAAEPRKPCILSLKAVLFDARMRCLLLRRSAANRHNVGKWELPGGKASPRETVEQAIVREVLEETGLAVTLVEPVGSGEADRGADHIVYLIVLVRAEDLHDGELERAVKLSWEHDAHLWVPPRELLTLAISEPLIPFATRLAEGGLAVTREAVYDRS